MDNSEQRSAQNQQNGQQGDQQSRNGQRQDTRSAQASQSLKQALERMEQGRRDGMAGSFDDLAERARRMTEEQRQQESELLSAYTRPANGAQGPGSGGVNGNRPNGLSWERAEAMAEKKRSLQSEVESLQRDMQASAQNHKEDAPQAASNVASAAENLAESNLSAALARSAMELERGRGIQAAGRERLDHRKRWKRFRTILSRAAQVASNESQQKRSGKDEATPDDLLAELSELRRAYAAGAGRTAEIGG